MTKARVPVLLALLVCLAAAAVPAAAQGPNRFGTRLRGSEEVPPIATPGGGRVFLTINDDETEIAWQLEYRNLEALPLQAHIHFAPTAVNGGIMVFFCSNLPSPPAGTQACPSPTAALSGTIRASDIIGPTSQGVAPGELFTMIRALRAGQAYANVHSISFPGGEIRGQLRVLGGGSSALEQE